MNIHQSAEILFIRNKLSDNMRNMPKYKQKSCFFIGSLIIEKLLNYLIQLLLLLFRLVFSIWLSCLAFSIFGIIVSLHSFRPELWANNLFIFITFIFCLFVGYVVCLFNITSNSPHFHLISISHAFQPWKTKSFQSRTPKIVLHVAQLKGISFSVNFDVAKYFPIFFCFCCENAKNRLKFFAFIHFLHTTNEIYDDDPVCLFI